jgi:hypothetical protein
MKYKQTADLNTHGTPGTVTAMVAATTPTRKAIFFADENNSAGIRIGPTNVATAYLVAAGQWYVIEGQAGRQDVLDLADWSVKSAMASAVYRIVYL